MSKLELLNSPLEMALRIILLLDQFKGYDFNVDEILMLDYYVIHLNDFHDNFESIHVPIPNRENELLVKRQLVVSGIDILDNKSLIKINYSKKGLTYSTNKLAESIVKHMDSSYFNKLVSNIKSISKYEISDVLNRVKNEVSEDSNLWINEWL